MCIFYKTDGVAKSPIYCVVPTRGINGFLTDLRYTICITEALSKIPRLGVYAYLYIELLCLAILLAARLFTGPSRL